MIVKLVTTRFLPEAEGFFVGLQPLAKRAQVPATRQRRLRRLREKEFTRESMARFIFDST
jgi:hypothetical protein